VKTFISGQSIVGNGCIIFSNKNYFEGDFLQGFSKIVGQFTKLTQNGLQTEGEWVDGLLEVRFI